MIVILLLLLVLGINFLVGKYAIKKGTDKIVDFGHKILPMLPENTNDILMIITIIFAIIFRNRLTHKYFKILAIMYFFRAITIFLTVLPVPEGREKCKPGFINHCNDFIFSGHTTFNVVTSYFIGKPLWPIWPVITSLGTVASKSHYSIDVGLVWIIFYSLISRFT